MRPATLIKRIVKALVLALALFYIGMSSCFTSTAATPQFHAAR